MIIWVTLGTDIFGEIYLTQSEEDYGFYPWYLLKDSILGPFKNK